MLTLELPALTPETRWISDVVLRQFLGIECRLGATGRPGYRLSDGHTALVLPDVFFAQVYRRPAAAGSPALPLAQWAPASLGLEAPLCAPTVPVVFGTAPAPQRPDAAALPLDVLGTAFFMLSRYEELDSLAADAHGRFPDAAALAVRAGFAERPLVDEYVEILWAAMQRQWPQLQRAPRQARTLISCDVDLPTDPACSSLFRLGRRMLRRCFRAGGLRTLPGLLASYLAVRRGEHGRDPYLQALDWIMEVNARAGHRVAFNIIPANTDPAIDHSLGLEDPRMVALLRTIAARGHEVGIHPGYHTYHHPHAFALGAAHLRTVLAALGIRQGSLGGRQHYLRWRPHVTPQLWEENRLAYDSSLGFADRPGFRCGTCREYTMFDLVRRRPLRLRQRPLLTMEPLRYADPRCRTQPLEVLRHYWTLTRRYGGDFTLLWHNSNLGTAAERDIYRQIVAA